MNEGKVALSPETGPIHCPKQDFLTEYFGCAQAIRNISGVLRPFASEIAELGQILA